MWYNCKELYFNKIVNSFIFWETFIKSVNEMFVLLMRVYGNIKSSKSECKVLERLLSAMHSVHLVKNRFPK